MCVPCCSAAASSVVLSLYFFGCKDIFAAHLFSSCMSCDVSFSSCGNFGRVGMKGVKDGSASLTYNEVDLRR